MDVVGTAGAEVLEAVAAANEKLIDLAARLRKRPEVRQVVRGLDCRRYASGAMLEGYVDAELTAGRALSWWLEVHWGQGAWVIESDVRVVHDAGQDGVQELPTRCAVGLDEFTRELAQAVDALVASADTIDLASFS